MIPGDDNSQRLILEGPQVQPPTMTTTSDNIGLVPDRGPPTVEVQNPHTDPKDPDYPHHAAAPMHQCISSMYRSCT